MEKVTKLEPKHHLMKFKASIMGSREEGKIYYFKSSNTYYLCQNRQSGCTSPDKLGYKEAWSVLSGDSDDLSRNNVTGLEVEPAIDYVYVSNVSEEDALIYKKKRILIITDKRFKNQYICVKTTDDDNFIAGKPVETCSWMYAVPIPENKWEPMEIKLNDNYSALVNETSVFVGCQTFKFPAIKELHDAVLKAEAFKA